MQTINNEKQTGISRDAVFISVAVSATLAIGLMQLRTPDVITAPQMFQSEDKTVTCFALKGYGMSCVPTKQIGKNS